MDGLTSRTHHAHRHFTDLRGSLRLRLASIFNHRPKIMQWTHYTFAPSKKQLVFFAAAAIVLSNKVTSSLLQRKSRTRCRHRNDTFRTGRPQRLRTRAKRCTRCHNIIHKQNT